MLGVVPTSASLAPHDTTLVRVHIRAEISLAISTLIIFLEQRKDTISIRSHFFYSLLQTFDGLLRILQSVRKDSLQFNSLFHLMNVFVGLP